MDEDILGITSMEFFRGVETTNQIFMGITSYICGNSVGILEVAWGYPLSIMDDFPGDKDPHQNYDPHQDIATENSMVVVKPEYGQEQW